MEAIKWQNVREKQKPSTKLLLTAVDNDADPAVVSQVLTDRVPVKLEFGRTIMVPREAAMLWEEISDTNESAKVGYVSARDVHGVTHQKP